MRLMTLEEYIARINSLAFWKEFTFAQNKFTPQPGREFELADNLVWLGRSAFVLQLKERENETDDFKIERNWFRRKILNKATKQVHDTLRFLADHQEIHVTNERGHSFGIRRSELSEIFKIIVYVGGRSLPEDCRRTRHHVSRTAGFIHILAAHDYLGVLEKLRVPEDIRRYFAYREEVISKLCAADVFVDEPDILGDFLSDEKLPTQGSQENLRRFVQDLESFDLSPLIGSLNEHIQQSNQPYDYYRIMLEFARVPRSVRREVKVRFVKALETVQAKRFTRPFRLTFPATGCAFMIAPLDPKIPASGPEGETRRFAGLTSLTYAAMYDAKVPRGIGILISKDGDYFQIDWSLLDLPWQFDQAMEARLATSNPFREVKEESVNSFLFMTGTEDT